MYWSILNNGYNKPGFSSSMELLFDRSPIGYLESCFYILIIFSYPLMVISLVFNRTGKYLYSEVKELEKRFSLYTKILTNYYLGFIFFQTLVSYAEIVMNESNIVYTNEIIETNLILYKATIIAMLISLSLKIPLLVHAAELFIIKEQSPNWKHALKDTRILFCIEFMAVVFSYILDGMFESNITKNERFKAAVSNQGFECATASTYASVLFLLIYTGILQHNNIW